MCINYEWKCMWEDIHLTHPLYTCTTMRHICSQKQQQFIYINEHKYALIHLISGSESEAVANMYNFFLLYVSWVCNIRELKGDKEELCMRCLNIFFEFIRRKNYFLINFKLSSVIEKISGWHSWRTSIHILHLPHTLCLIFYPHFYMENFFYIELGLLL